jgi:hypothetical protein
MEHETTVSNPDCSGLGCGVALKDCIMDLGIAICDVDSPSIVG